MVSSSCRQSTMCRSTQLVFTLTLAVAAHAAVVVARLNFIPPEAVLQAGRPWGFRAFIPDFPGCELFAFHGKLNSPFGGDEVGSVGTFFNEILHPKDGLWTFEDMNAVLTPGDVLHYWTMVVKDKTPYPRKNLTWTVPELDESVDLIRPVISYPSRPRPTPEKMRDTEPTTPREEPTTPSVEPTTPSAEPTTPSGKPTTPSGESTTPSAESTTPSGKPTTPSGESTTPSAESTTPSGKPTTPREEPTTAAANDNKPASPPDSKEEMKSKNQVNPEAEMVTVNKTQSLDKLQPTDPKTIPPEPINPFMSEHVEELTTPALPEKPFAPEEFPLEPSPLFPFPPLFPTPFKPPMRPPFGPRPGLDLCSSPWNFEEQFGDTRSQKLEKQVAKLQCQLSFFQRGYSQFGNSVENELNDLKKLMSGMANRMTRLETLLQNAAFG